MFVEVIDHVGNSSGIQNVGTISLDLTAPTPSMDRSGLAPNGHMPTSLITGGQPLGGSVANDDTVSIRARGTDVFGKQSDWFGPFELVVDLAAPTVQVTTDTSIPLGADIIPQLTGTATDNRLLQAVELCASDGTACQTLPPIYTWDSTGEHPVSVDLTDNNETTTLTETIAVIAPTMTVEVAPSPALVGTDVEVVARITPLQ